MMVVPLIWRTRFVVQAADGAVKPGRQAPTAAFTGEGGFRPPHDFT
jgi:hypothetical protein